MSDSLGLRYAKQKEFTCQWLPATISPDNQHGQGLSPAQLLALVELFIFITFYFFLPHYNLFFAYCQLADIRDYPSLAAMLHVTLSPLNWASRALQASRERASKKKRHASNGSTRINAIKIPD